MSDEIDGIVEREYTILQANIEAARKSEVRRTPTPKGSCYNCSEPFTGSDSNLSYCDKDCADDHVKYAKR